MAPEGGVTCPFLLALGLGIGPSDELPWWGWPLHTSFASPVPQVPSDGPLEGRVQASCLSVLSDCGPASGQFTRGLGKKCFPLDRMIFLLWGYSNPISSHPALWGEPHSPAPSAFDRWTEKFLIRLLRSRPVGLSASPSLMPPDSCSVPLVLNRCLLLTKQ